MCSWPCVVMECMGRDTNGKTKNIDRNKIFQTHGLQFMSGLQYTGCCLCILEDGFCCLFKRLTLQFCLSEHPCCEICVSFLIQIFQFWFVFV